MPRYYQFPDGTTEIFDREEPACEHDVYLKHDCEDCDQSIGPSGLPKVEE